MSELDDRIATAAGAQPCGDARISGERRSSVQREILDWYDRHGRDLPWRHTRDPYRVLVAEVMLQQTQVDRVVPKYHEFLVRFPTIADLAAASRADVIRAWAPLGYNMRAVRLHEVARQCVEELGGGLPTEPAELLDLKGIGPYTAAAVACFAGGQPVAVLDTNVRRVLGRIFAGDPAGLSSREAWRLAETSLPPERVYDWNQALMDLGATVCVAARPRCLLCPVSAHCVYRAGISSASSPPATSRIAEQRKRYVTQPFVGSSRYYRGRVVDALRALPRGESVTLDDLARRLDPARSNCAWLAPIAERLERDGLIKVERLSDALASRLSLP